MELDKDVRTLLCEIIIMLLIIAITVPICVNASNRYKSKKNNIEKYTNVGINISNKNDNMVVTLNNKNKNEVVINLILKTTKFSNNYSIMLDDKEYNLSEIEYSEDDNNYYFNLGSYKFKDSIDVKFKLFLIGNDIYDDSITYSFIAEVVSC